MVIHRPGEISDTRNGEALAHIRNRDTLHRYQEVAQNGAIRPVLRWIAGGVITLLLLTGGWLAIRQPSQPAPASGARLDPHLSRLHAAAQKGDTVAVRQLLLEGYYVDARNYQGMTPLHIAAEYGHAELAALLIAEGADIEAKSNLDHEPFHGATPLMLAEQSKYAAVVELLVSAGAEAGTSNGEISLGESANLAIEPVNSDLVEPSVENGANIETAATLQLDMDLSRAVGEGRKALAELLISKGANVNSENIFENRPLHNAAVLGDLDIINLLLANDANIGAKAPTGAYPGETALHAAAFGGHLRAVELLLTNGADINATDLHGHTPIRRAVERGDEKMANLLIEKGADITIRDGDGKTLLHVVAPARHVAVAEQLIAGGVDINALDNSGFAPLDYARGGVAIMVETLERHGGVCTSCQ